MRLVGNINLLFAAFRAECLKYLPERDGPEYEEIMLKTLGQVKLVKPTVCVSQKSRFGFTMCKQSIPHSEDVPISIACFDKCVAGKMTVRSAI